MKRTSILCALLASSLLAGPLAIAQGDSRYPNPGYGEGRRNNEPDRRDDARQPNQNRNNGNNNGNNNGRNRGFNNGRDYDHRGERGAGPDHNYYRGERMPLQYRTPRYVVDDWRGHRLAAPPRGYHWVQSGSDYILVAIATGVILNLLLNN